MENASSKEDLMSASDVAEGSDAMVEIKIKTIDSQTYTMRVNKFLPVPDLKEQVAVLTGVISDQQRLICRGKVLKDDDLLSAYNVEDGHTLHLVVRQPVSSMSISSSAGQSESASEQGTTLPSNDHIRGRTFVFEAINVGSVEHANSGLDQILGRILGSLLSMNNGPENSRTNRAETNSQTQARRSDEPSARDAINSSSHSPTVEFEAQEMGFPFSAASTFGSQDPAVLSDSLTTINQYLGLIREELRNEVLRASTRSSISEAAPLHSSGSEDIESHPAFGQSGLQNPSFLAEVLVATRELLAHRVGECLSLLARELENQANISDLSVRSSVQSSAIRIGVLLQNLGPLLLELGRATMTLRIGQRPSEAVVNAGPAVFISSSGPNPLMVQQPFPSLPGSNSGHFYTGTVGSNNGLEDHPLGRAYAPRSVEIQIHDGHSTPLSSNGPNDQSWELQIREDPVRNSVASSVNQASSAVSENASSSGDSGVQILPMRTVIAVPAGASRSSDSSSSGAGLFYPLIARVQQFSAGNLNNVSGSQPSGGSQNCGSQNDQQELEQTNRDAPSDSYHSASSSTPLVSPVGSSADEGAQHQGSARVYVAGSRRPHISNDSTNHTQNGQQRGQSPSGRFLNRIDQTIGHIVIGNENQMENHSQQNLGVDSATGQANIAANSQTHDTQKTCNEQGIFFSNLMHQIMPYISQGRVPEFSASNPGSLMVQEGKTEANSSNSIVPQDPPESRSSKRQKSE